MNPITERAQRRAELLKTYEDKLPVTLDTLITTEGHLTAALLYKWLYNAGFRIATVDTDITKDLNHLLNSNP